jgi:hypothetical protein
MNREEKDTHQEETTPPAKAETGTRRDGQASVREGAMNSGVRIIKRGSVDGPQSLPPGRDEKTDQQREREIAGMVKGWIAEWERAKSARLTECLRQL